MTAKINAPCGSKYEYVRRALSGFSYCQKNNVFHWLYLVINWLLTLNLATCLQDAYVQVYMKKMKVQFLKYRRTWTIIKQLLDE